MDNLGKSNTSTMEVSLTRKPEVVKILGGGNPRYYIRFFESDSSPKLEEIDKPTHPEDPVEDYVNLKKRKTSSVEEDDHDEEVQGKTWPMAAHISDDIVNNILSNEYVEFESLLQDRHLSKEILKTLQEVDGELVWQAKKSSTVIGCWFTWAKAFAVYASIYVQRHVKEGPGLWQHFMYITSSADRYQWDAIYAYDIKWRMNKAKKSSLKWGFKDQDLWSEKVQSTKVFDPNQQFLIPKSNAANKKNYGKPGGPGYNFPPCWNWNRGYCNTPGCKFSHNKCRRCFRLGHKFRDCRSTTDKNGNPIPQNWHQPRVNNVEVISPAPAPAPAPIIHHQGQGGRDNGPWEGARRR